MTFTTERLEFFVDYCQKNIIVPAKLSFSPELKIIYGKKFARIARIDTDMGLDGAVSAWGFVDMTTGDILKAAGWNAPAKNFARGNINNDPSTWKFQWTGIQ